MRCRASPYVHGGVYLSDTEQDRTLKFCMQTPYINTIFENCHAPVILDNVDILNLEDENVYRPVLKNKSATMFFRRCVCLCVCLSVCLSLHTITQKEWIKKFEILTNCNICK